MHAGQARQGLLGRLGEAGQQAAEADGLVGGRGQVVRAQPQQGVARAGAAMAVRAEVIMPPQPQRPEEADDGTGAEALATGVVLAVRAGHAGALVPLFFRSFRAVCRAWAPRRWTRSRTWNSVGPRRWASGWEARRRARRRASSRKG